MKRIFKITATYLCLFLLIMSCSKDEVEPEIIDKKEELPVAASINLSASSTTLVANGKDNISFEVVVREKKEILF